jgi:hypothetical protein
MRGNNTDNIRGKNLDFQPPGVSLLALRQVEQHPVGQFFLWSGGLDPGRERKKDEEG